ncbi:MAG: hypothetical protein Q7T01_01920 [bacterium]|nr:hypothetical protein [bacterium]
MITIASAGHCVGCGTPGTTMTPGFLCALCGNPERIRYVCGRCTNREKLAPSSALATMLNQALPNLGNRTTGITIVGSVCSSCRRPDEGAGAVDVYIVTRAS